MNKLLAVNLAAAPGTVKLRGKNVVTGIHKSPQPHPVWVDGAGLAGDRQVDRRYHGGPTRAVCIYGAQHWPRLAEYLGARYPNLGPGALGENLTWQTFDEAEIHVGDVFRLGPVELRITAPRRPCVKLGAKLGHAGLPKKMLAWGCLGAYAEVTISGYLSADIAIERIETAPAQPTLAQVIAGWRTG